MEAQIPPAKIARFADSGMLSMEMPSTGLGLGLGPGLGNGKSAFTFLQLQELEHQALIFKYMVAGVPVPFHLVLPIWKSVASSTGGIYRHHPTWFEYNSLCYRNSMEPEPGRCRRTDGKKWRCSKDVVPDQKYCERHMHRGRQRSRKPVEGQAAATNSSTTTTTTVESSTDSNTHLSISIPVGLELMTAGTAAAAATNRHQNTHNSISISISPSLGFSPTSVLQSNSCKTERSL